MKYGELIEHCENLNGECIKCNYISKCRSLRHGLDLHIVQPCDISRLWNEEIKDFDDLSFRLRFRGERRTNGKKK